MAEQTLEQSLAREFMLGFRTALTCPDVSPSEYEGVMEHKIADALRAERAAGWIAGREAAAKVAANPYSDAVQCYGSDEPSEVCAKVIAAIRNLKPPEGR